MISFLEFLRQQISADGFSTEDVLVSFLPLMQQVIATHNNGQVAPFDGVGKLQVVGVNIVYAEADAMPQRWNLSGVKRLLQSNTKAVQVVGESRVLIDVNTGDWQQKDLQIADDQHNISRPVYLAGYVCWEHLLGHHDPASDVFCLGLILASLACGLDLTEPKQLELFVTNRTNLFRVNSKLHPVLARAISVMTELDRNKRPQDLQALFATLDNYRDQEVDFETDLASTADLQNQNRSGKRKVILSKLQERLFEISRRNRLLHFRSTLLTINLTQASIPISFDVANIRESQVLTWNAGFRDAIAKQKPVQLNSTLNFREALYLPGALDRLRSEARRDENEYGFAELKLVICFLRWADLKATPAERYESPLLLVPVKLDVKKGIHDRYFLTSQDPAAEVNPVVRHLFKQLYNIDLPEQVNLANNGVAQFYDDIKAKIHASDAAVELTRIDRPRIKLIHEKAKRRLDQFRNRARLSGRGIQHFMDLDYCYDPISYHPLGFRIFESFVRPTPTHLERITQTKSPTRRNVIAQSEDDAADSNTAQAEQQFYSLESENDDNPYNWEFDLCSVTLANLKYRRMSLVRDYTRLVNDNTENAAFEATFSIAPAERLPDTAETVPLTDRFHVVACDPTQQEAIARARSGQSYIIQGPPGTGKSQTITNLIADFIARDKRVLFVCEKRAAIDVVYHRLKQEGLHEICCLIHDSQSDKKQFVQDLKKTYEAFLSEASAVRDGVRHRRNELVEKLEAALAPVAGFNAAMTSQPAEAGISVRALLNRLIELQQHVPELVPRDWERVCSYADWRVDEAAVREFSARLLQLQPDGIFAKHVLCLLSEKVLDADQPVALVTECVKACVGEGDNPKAGRLTQLLDAIQQLQLPTEVVSSLDQLRQAVQYAAQSLFLSEHKLFDLLDPNSDVSKKYSKFMKRLEKAEKAVAAAQKDTVNWKTKLSSGDTQAALQIAAKLDGNFTAVFKPAWWRLRIVLHKSYDFSQHAVKPTWVHILTQLDQEHDQLAARYSAVQAISDEFLIQWDAEKFHQDLLQLRQDRQKQSGPILTLIEYLFADKNGSRKARELAALQEPLNELVLQLERFVDDYEHQSLETLVDSLQQIKSAIPQLPDFLHCLAALRPLPQKLRQSVRSLPLTLIQLEAAAAEKTLQDIYRSNRVIAEFNGNVRSKQIAEVAESSNRLRQANAATVRENVRQRFNDHANLAEKSATVLAAEEKEFKKLYSRGRRELEREFSKSMRYRAIRELADGDSGVVLRDLKPVWLMSPLSVSDTLPLTAHHFDVVIFDEASQITLEEAIPSLFRAEQTIVVGDEMQLPPTSFFATKREDDEDLAFEEAGELVQYDLNSNSFLNHTSRNLPSRMLGWHYRSRSESLISFSNHAFYGGRLLTVPEERLSPQQQTGLLIAQPSDGKQFAAELLNRPVSFHFLENGIYDKRRNIGEAQYIAELVRELLLNGDGHSIGIVAFSEAQQEEIERAIRTLAADDAQFAELLEAEWEREQDGQFIGLLIKNLENIQGDERDMIILSVCYGPDPEGKIRMNFGPINMAGGEKRLNVAFSRAKQFMALVSSMRSTAITNDYNDGANCLKNYLRYAECCSIGQSTSVLSVLQSLSGRDDAARFQTNHVELLADEISAAVQELGFCVDRHIGQSQFHCDLAIYQPTDIEYRLGIMIDGDQWYSQTDLLERELMKPQLLEAFGWQMMIVLAKDWYHDKAAVIASIANALS